VEIRFFFFQSTSFTSSTFPTQPDFSQNQPAAFTLNTGSPRTLLHTVVAVLEESFLVIASRGDLAWSLCN
jgi:hypothetical protein